MKWTMRRAWLLGVGVLVAAYVLWWAVAAGVEHAEALRMVLFAVPVLAAALVTYLAPNRKIALGLSMGLVGAMLGMAAMSFYRSLGVHIDQIGGPVATLGILLAIHVAYAAVGTLVGYLLWRIRSKMQSASV